MKKFLRWFFCLHWLLPTSTQDWKGEAVKVPDGDTLHVKQGKKTVKVRLYGVDCPESKQKYGDQATAFARELLLGKKVRVEALHTDQYGRTVGLVSRGRKMLNRELVRAGYAWVYPAYCRKQPLCGELSKLEQRAKIKKAGLWRDNRPMPPWEWRKKKRK